MQFSQKQAHLVKDFFDNRDITFILHVYMYVLYILTFLWSESSLFPPNTLKLPGCQINSTFEIMFGLKYDWGCRYHWFNMKMGYSKKSHYEVLYLLRRSLQMHRKKNNFWIYVCWKYSQYIFDIFLHGSIFCCIFCRNYVNLFQLDLSRLELQQVWATKQSWPESH